MTAGRRMAIVGFTLIAGACASGRFGPAPSPTPPLGPHTLKNLSVNERDALLARANVWEPIDTHSLDLAAGPPLPQAQSIPSELPCRFVFPDKPLTGNTPKFRCAVGPQDVVKVKYGAGNGEVYAQVAASRLFWALGFKADSMYPSTVVCQDCPQKPFAVSRAHWDRGMPSQLGRYVFDPAAVERPFPGSAIEVTGFEGWAWPELDKVNPDAGGAPRAQVDALKLLAVFIQHSDNKPEQQRFVCAPDAVQQDRDGNETCSSPWLVAKDLGTTFGKATKLNHSKMQLDDWARARMWRHGARCVGDLPRSLTGSLENPRISEAGRAFLAERLLLLDDRQIRDLFIAARADRRDGSIDSWVLVFKRKRDEIVQAHCPS